MSDMQRIDELGLADFVAMLLVETLDSIVVAHTSQEERLRALEQAAAQTVEEFAQSVTDDLVEASLTELFGAVQVGHAAPPATALADLGIELGEDDVTDGVLTEADFRAVTEGVRLHLARSNQEAVQKMAERGIPRIKVDGGVLRSKLTFSAVRKGDEAEPVSQKTAPKRESSIAEILAERRIDPYVLGLPSRYVSALQTGVLDSIAKTRLTVRPATAGEPTQETTTTIYGEVEIHFHAE